MKVKVDHYANGQGQQIVNYSEFQWTPQFATGGERRYSKYLFEICHELIKDDITSDSTKVLKEGVLVKIKNKGSKPTKEKYESSVRQNYSTKQIPAMRLGIINKKMSMEDIMTKINMVF